jgi:hypothetical protein
MFRTIPLIAFLLAVCAVPAAPAEAQVVTAVTGTADQPAIAAPPPKKQSPGLLEWLWNSMTDEASITASVGVLQASMTVERKSDGAKATIAQRDENALFLSYSTKPSFFEDSNFGYTVMVNYIRFDMNRQEYGKNNLVDVGTEVTGQMLYAVPTLYYQWGEHHYDGTFIRLGVGAGVGTATYSGTLRMATAADPQETVHTANWSYAPHLALSDFLEARWKHFGISVSYAAPRIHGDVYDIRVSNFTVQLGYTYYF